MPLLSPVDDPLDPLRHLGVVDVPTTSHEVPSLVPLDQVGPRDPECSCDRPHRESSFFGKGGRDKSFFFASDLDGLLEDLVLEGLSA
jgi:hypothetical protein